MTRKTPWLRLTSCQVRSIQSAPLSPPLTPSCSHAADEDDSEIDEEAHAAQLKALAAKDPEFFKYLQANDEELLKFGQDSDDDDASEDDEDDSDEEDEAPKAKKDAKGKAKATDMDVDEDEGPQVVTLEMLRSWQRSLIQVSRQSSA